MEMLNRSDLPTARVPLRHLIEALEEFSPFLQGATSCQYSALSIVPFAASISSQRSHECPNPPVLPYLSSILALPHEVAFLPNQSIHPKQMLLGEFSV